MQLQRCAGNPGHWSLMKAHSSSYLHDFFRIRGICNRVRILVLLLRAWFRFSHVVTEHATTRLPVSANNGNTFCTTLSECVIVQLSSSCSFESVSLEARLWCPYCEIHVEGIESTAAKIISHFIQTRHTYKLNHESGTLQSSVRESCKMKPHELLVSTPTAIQVK